MYLSKCIMTLIYFSFSRFSRILNPGHRSGYQRPARGSVSGEGGAPTDHPYALCTVHDQLADHNLCKRSRDAHRCQVLCWIKYRYLTFFFTCEVLLNRSDSYPSLQYFMVLQYGVDWKASFGGFSYSVTSFTAFSLKQVLFRMISQLLWLFCGNGSKARNFLSQRS